MLNFRRVGERASLAASATSLDGEIWEYVLDYGECRKCQNTDGREQRLVVQEVHLEDRLGRMLAAESVNCDGKSKL